jgi:hypothetical protein
MLRADQIGYAYSNADSCPAAAPVSGASFLGADDTRTYPLAPGAALNRGVTRIPLRPSAETRDALRISQFLSADVQQRTLLIEDITFDKPPQTSYKVFLVNSSGERALAGVVNFFGAADHSGHGGTGAGRDARLDVTNTLPAVSPSGQLPEGLTLEFVPSTGVTGTTQAEATQNIPDDANVRYGSVALIVVSGQ